MTHEYLQKLFGMTEQVAVVIGGTGVLGGTLCEGLALAGASVVVAGRDVERGEQKVQFVRDLGSQSVFLPVDSTSRASMQALLDAVLSEFGQVDMLVNAAGVNSAEPYFDITDEAFDLVLATNLKSTHLGCQIFGRHMALQAQGGSILNLGSVSANVPLSRVFAYSASKAAVVNLSQNIARELASRGRPGQCAVPWFFSRRAESQSADARAHRVDYEANADGAIWRARGIDRSGPAVVVANSRGVYHGVRVVR